ncbi:MAG: AAA family ATPase [Terracidiphilus sp.]
MKQFDPFRLDASNGCLWRGGVSIAMPPKPFAVLRYLVENPGRLITHDELLDALWPETYVQPQVLRTYMLELRKVLGDDAGQPRYIQTLPKRGYRFVAPVSEWEGAGSMPAPAVHGGKPSGFVNRDHELARLNAEFEPAAGGERRVVFITGEAGIGKTALADAFCRPGNLAQPAAVAHGHCVPGIGAREEYYPVMEALGQLCASPDGEAACKVLQKLAPVWLAQLGRRLEAAPSTAPLPVQERMPGDLCAALEELARAKPLILVFEDLHWADECTLDLMSALARRRAPAKLLVLATYRPQDLATEHPLKALKQDLLLHRLCAEIALAPLSKSSLTQLLSRELRQQALPDELGAFVHQRSEGNPLFAIAILEHLIAQQFLVRQAAGGAAEWRLRTTLLESDAGLPGDLAQMVELEIERLSPREQSALEAGSLMKVAFPAWAVAAALDEDAVEAEDLCDGLARRLHFVERAGQDELPGGVCSAFYVFAHGLYREVLYRRQSAARRARSHTRIAQRLGQLFKGREPDVAREMAMHFEAAGSWQLAAAALRSAALHAERRQAHAEAAELLERALRIAHSFGGSERTPEAAR